MLIWQSKYTETRSSTRSWQFDCYRWCDYPSHPASLWCCYCYRDEKKGTAQRKCCLRMFGQSSTWKSSWSGWPFIVRRSRNNVRPFLWFMCFALVLFYKTCFHSIGGQLSLKTSLIITVAWQLIQISVFRRNLIAWNMLGETNRALQLICLWTGLKIVSPISCLTIIRVSNCSQLMMKKARIISMPTMFRYIDFLQQIYLWVSGLTFSFMDYHF